MLNKELSHFSESSRSGNQISEYICSTFLGILLFISFFSIIIRIVVYISVLDELQQDAESDPS